MTAHGSTWTYGWYHGAGNVAGLLGIYAGNPAIVAGAAEGVFLEVLDARAKLGIEAVVFAANDVGMYLDRLDHWVSLHADHLMPWKQARWLHHKGPEDVRFHAPQMRDGIDYVWDGLTPMFALSGYFAMQIAYLMGCEPIMLCGCPGDRTRRFFEADSRRDFGYGNHPEGRDTGCREQLEQAMKQQPDFKAKVRSMNGWTKAFFGGL